MYSFHPVKNLADDHTGFYILLSIVLVVLIAARMIEWDSEREKDTFFHIALTFFSVCIGVGAYVSWMDKPPKNEQVIAVKVKEYEDVSTAGKSTRPFPVMHVIYKVPDGEVSFRKYDGALYPDRVVLYKN